jgi:TPR repeat protein
MPIENLCNQYLNAYKTIQNYKTNTTKENILAGFCVLTYLTLLAPLAILTISAMASLYGRVTKKIELSPTDHKVNKAVENLLWIKFKANVLGQAEAQFQLAECYSKDKEIFHKEKIAAKLFFEAAKKGHAGAQVKWGECLEFGKGTTKNVKEAVEWYKKASDQGNSIGQFIVANCLSRGLEMKKDPVDAIELYKKSADQGNREAMFTLGQCYENGNGVDKDKKLSFEWYKKAAEKGHVEAQHRVGRCFMFGNGVDINFKAASEWLKKAAVQGQVNAILDYLGWCRVSDKEAFELYKKGALLGHAGCQNKLGELLFAKNEKAAAIKWFRKSAEQNNSDAQMRLGNCLYKGDGIDENRNAAEEWYKKSADNGNTNAMFKLGELNDDEGFNVTSFSWYKKAAENGHTEAQCVVGYRLDNGIGVAKDPAEALEWYKKSARRGNENAIAKLKQLGISI